LARKTAPKQKPGKDPRGLKGEIRALVFLLLGVAIAGSLFSYHPADRLYWNVTDPVGTSHNLFGTAGAHLGGGLVFLVGFSAFWLVLIFLVLSILSFRGVSPNRPWRSVTAAFTLIVSSSALLTLQFNVVSYKGAEINAGGLVGLLAAGWSRDYLNSFGAYALFLTVFIISLMILTHLSLGWLFSKFSLAFLGAFRQIGERAKKRSERKQRARKTMAAKKKLKQKPKVTIVQSDPEPQPRQEQEQFPFMQVAGELQLPSLDLLDDPPQALDPNIHHESLEVNARRVERKLADFGVQGEVTEILPGPLITMYEFKPAPGVKISKVAGLSDDLALALRAPSIRIVAPIPGKAAIGIEIPNSRRERVVLKDVLSSSAYRNCKHDLPIALGKDITGSPYIADLCKMPHLLVAGATGAGKSVSLNAMINSLLFKASPEMVRFLIIDPKRIELSIYQDIPHLLHPVVTQPKEATKALQWAVQEMERRYMLLSDRGVRNIGTYNRKVLKQGSPDGGEGGKPATLPYLILIIDELADLMMASSREVEEAIARLAQMARAAGIHLIIATQRPSVDILTGIIKANFPARISFQVSSRVDSRTILDSIGAEALLGEGDMLFMPPAGIGRMMRIHGAYVSEDEVLRVTDFLKKQMEPDYDQTVVSEIARAGAPEEEPMDLDEKYDQAVDVVVRSGQASISMLQRKLRVGYNRAARMIEAMEKEGIVGPSDGVRPREVFGRKVT